MNARYYSSLVALVLIADISSVLAQTLVRSVATERVPHAIASSRNGKVIAVGYEGDAIEFRRWPSLEKIEDVKLERGRDSAVTSIEFSVDGTTVLAEGRCVGPVWVLHCTPDGHAHSMAPPIRELYKSALSPDGKTIAAVRDDKDDPVVLSVHDRRVQATFPIADQWISALAYSPNGELLAAAGMGRKAHDWIVTVWDVPKRTILYSVVAQHNAGAIGVSGFPGIVFSPDGKLLASLHASRGLMVWDTATMKLRVAKRHPLLLACFLSDGTTVGTSDGVSGKIDFTSVVTSKSVGSVDTRLGQIHCLVPVPHSANLVVGGSVRTIVEEIHARNVADVYSGKDQRGVLKVIEFKKTERRIIPISEASDDK